MMLRRSISPAGFAEGVAEGVSERQVAQVADVQRLGRVGVPEIEREAPAGGDVATARHRLLALLQRGSPPVDPAVVEAQPDLAAVGFDRLDPGQALDPLQVVACAAILLPVRRARHQHQVEALVRPVGRPQGPVRLGASPASRFVEVVEEIDVHSPGETHCRCTSRGSNPDPRLTNPIL